MGPHLVVTPSPLLDTDARIDTVANQCTLRHSSRSFPLNEFVGGILPWLARIDQPDVDRGLLVPSENCRDDELRAVRWANTWLTAKFSRLLELRGQDPGPFNYPIAVFSEWRGNAFYLNVRYRARSRRPEDDFVVRHTRMTLTGFGRFDLAYFRHTSGSPSSAD